MSLLQGQIILFLLIRECGKIEFTISVDNAPCLGKAGSEKLTKSDHITSGKLLAYEKGW
jgi:hypothetical protein